MIEVIFIEYRYPITKYVNRFWKIITIVFQRTGLTTLFGLKSKDHAIWCCSGCFCSIFTGFFLGHRQQSKIKWAFLSMLLLTIVVVILNTINFYLNVKRKLFCMQQHMIWYKFICSGIARNWPGANRFKCAYVDSYRCSQ